MFRVIILFVFAFVIYSSDVSAQGFNYQIENEYNVRKPAPQKQTKSQRNAAKSMEYKQQYFDTLPTDQREAMETSAQKMLHDPKMKKMMMDSLNDFEGEEREKLRKIYEEITGSVKKSKADIRASKK